MGDLEEFRFGGERRCGYFVTRPLKASKLMRTRVRYGGRDSAAGRPRGAAEPRRPGSAWGGRASANLSLGGSAWGGADPNVSASARPRDPVTDGPTWR